MERRAIISGKAQLVSYKVSEIVAKKFSLKLSQRMLYITSMQRDS